jgi:hypothetical protein
MRKNEVDTTLVVSLRDMRAKRPETLTAVQASLLAS